MTNRVLVTFNLSKAEKELLDRLAGSNKSAYLRNLILEDAKRRHISVPEDRLEDTRKTHWRGKE